MNQADLPIPSEPPSPSANGNRGAPSADTTRFRRHELKLVLDAREANLVKDFARLNFAEDRYSPGGTPYAVHSLYLDSSDFAVYHRRLDDGDTKYRIRRYGTEPFVWLERKRRNGVLVRKRRERIPLEAMAAVFSGPLPAGEFIASFAGKVRAEHLVPRLLISYPRSAWNAGPGARLTLDWAVEARRPASDAWFDLAKPALAATSGVILELKFDEECPALFGVLLQLLGREGASWSKYAHGVEAFELTCSRGLGTKDREGPAFRNELAG